MENRTVKSLLLLVSSGHDDEELMSSNVQAFFIPLVTPLRTVKLGGKDCDFKGEKICNGAVTKEIGTKLVKVCTDGVVKIKTRKSVGEGFPLVGRDTGAGKDCIWYGTVFCDGDLLEVRDI